MPNVFHDRRLDETVAWIRRQWPRVAMAGAILGTGMGGFTRQILADVVLPYCEIPHFQRSTALGHRGQLVCGEVAGVPVVAMDGRIHGYEGYSLDEITFPVRVMRGLGIGLLLVTNASGGLNPRYSPGDILVIDDHVNLLWRRPLGSSLCEIDGSRGPALCRPYDPGLAELALGIARRANFVAHRGVYIGVLGPNYETRAEYRMLRRIGGDAVGMSTVPEVIVAARLGIRVLGLSTIANVGLPDSPHKTTGEEVMAAVSAAEPKARQILLRVIEQQARATEQNGRSASTPSPKRRGPG